jgi:hypothetical protein
LKSKSVGPNLKSLQIKGIKLAARGPPSEPET